MKISARITNVHSMPRDSFSTMDTRSIAPRDKYIVEFLSPDAIIKLEISEQSNIAEHLALFAHENGKDSEFIFDIGGKPVADHFQRKINALKLEIDDRRIAHNKVCERIYQNEHDISFYKKRLNRIEGKWWYKLFKSW